MLVYFRENPKQKWIRIGGTPILGNLHIYFYSGIFQNFLIPNPKILSILSSETTQFDYPNCGPTLVQRQECHQGPILHHRPGVIVVICCLPGITHGNGKFQINPYAPCMVYLTTFGWFLGQMLVNIPYMEHMGNTNKVIQNFGMNYYFV